jgi:superfamily II DNA helicase RecQ
MTLLVTILTLPFDTALEGFDLSALESLQRRAEILDCASAFHVQGGRAYWSLVVKHRTRSCPGESPRAAAPADGPGRPAVAPADEGTYQALRVWRGKVADADGIPPFMILTNRQIASLASLRPASLSALGSVPGIGRGRLSKYGRAILAVLHGPDPQRGEERTERSVPAESATSEAP